MNKFKTKIAVLAICFLSFAGIQTASAVEGLSIGAAMNYSGFMARGKEAATSSGNNIKRIGTMARKEMQSIFDFKVHLFIRVKVRENCLIDTKLLQSIGIDTNA